jgi:apolipoprotein N-acyltransferase
VRAVEEGLPIVRSANNGVSAIIDGYGRVLTMLRLNARGVIDSPVPAALAAPPYARFGDWTFVAMVIALAAAATFLARNRRR